MNIENFIEKNDLHRCNTEDFITYNRMVPKTDHTVNIYLNDNVFMKSTSHQLYTSIRSIIGLLPSTVAWYIQLEIEKTSGRPNLLITAYGNDGKLIILLLKFEWTRILTKLST